MKNHAEKGVESNNYRTFRFYILCQFHLHFYRSGLYLNPCGLLNRFLKPPVFE